MRLSPRFSALFAFFGAAASAAPQGPTDHLLVHVADPTGFAPAISRYDEAGTLDFSTGLNATLEFNRVAFTEDGGMVTFSENPRRLVFFSAAGVQVQSFPVPEVLNHVWDIEVLANGEIAVTDGAVHYYSAAGVHRMTDSSWTSFTLHEDREDGLWGGATGGGFSFNYGRLDPVNGGVLDGFSIPFGFDMATAPDGTIWIAIPFGSGAVANYRRDGTLLSSFATPGPVLNIEVGSDGSLWVGEWEGDRVLHYSTTGDLLGWIPVFVGSEGSIVGLDIGRAETFGSTLCAGEVNSTGSGATVRASGAAAVQENELILDVSGLPTGSAGYFLMSDATGQVPVSQGVLCLGSPVLRFSLHVLHSSSGGWAQFRPDQGSLPQGTVISPGSTWHFQYWYRDANPGPVSNLSDAVSLTFQ